MGRAGTRRAKPQARLRICVSVRWGDGADRAGPVFCARLIAAAAFFVAAVTRRGQLGWGVIYVGAPVLSLLLLRYRPTGCC